MVTNLRKVGSRLKDIAALARALPGHLRRRMSVDEAKLKIQHALDRREDRFLEIAKTHVYGRSRSPYLRLLRNAGCEFGDLAAQLRRDGLEATLERLAREGVYVTSDEFKGKREIVRSGNSFRVSPADFEPATRQPGFSIRSSGTTNRPVESFIPLTLLATQAATTSVFLAAHGLFSHTHAVYDAILPGAGGFFALLMYGQVGLRTERWFGRRIPSTSVWAAASSYVPSYLIIYMGRLFGHSFPTPEFIDVSEVGHIAKWVEERRRDGVACCITTAASNAARIARVARELGMSMEGARFIVGGDPLTAAKREAIEKAGGRAVSRYVYGGCLLIGYGCAKPLHTDEIHVDQSGVALIQNPRPIGTDGPTVHGLLCTTLNPSASRLLINVDNGDYATLTTRACGCGLEPIGLGLHLHQIRSYEKFTSEGMNYFYGDLFDLLEKTLPEEFGGGPGDYQLVEEEDQNGQTRLTLVVHPQVGSVDEQRLVWRLRDGLGQGSWANRFQARIWQEAGTVRVKRAAPHASARGKILPLHMPR